MQTAGALRHILVASWLVHAPALAQEVSVADAVPRADAVADALGANAFVDPSSALSEPLPEPIVEEPAVRPRYWRYPRDVVRRPLTLPQFVGRLDSTIALSTFPAGASGSTTTMSGFMSIAGGILDDLEIGAVPLTVTFFPFPRFPADPYTYVRARALAGEVQIAFRGGTTIPIDSQSSAQMALGAELAWLVAPFFRLDVALDYQLLFSSPLHQRVGVPITGTFQAGIHAITLTSGVFVFNDFDDVDVPLTLGYVVTFNGYRQPHGEWGFESGFTDLEFAQHAWTIRSRFTFFV